MILLSALALIAPQLASTSAPGDPASISALGGSTVTPFDPRMAASALPGRMLDITLNLPGQTYQERFILGIPDQIQVPAPVLTLFHGYGEDPTQVVQNTDLAARAMERGWIAFIPLGAHHYNYGIDYAQENIETTFEFLSARLPLDLDRIYGVGFSMGGGAAASFAARHLDPLGIHFAALVNHTGTTSLRATYHTSNDKALFESPLMFGSTPESDPFAYLRSSVVDLDPFTGTLDPTFEMARNLATIPTQNWYAFYDINQSIVDQTVALHGRLGALGGATTEVVVNSSAHEWATLDTTAVLDWLEPQSWSAPQPGAITRTLADRSGRWHELEITQATPDAFTPVLWSGQPAVNALYLIDMKNAARIETDLGRHGLDLAQTTHVVTQTLDGTAPTLILAGFAQAPFTVQHRGDGSPNWTHDAASETLTLTETGTATWSQWVIVP